MHRLSAHNVLAWIGGVATVIALGGLQFGYFEGPVGVIIIACGVLAASYFVFDKVRAHQHSTAIREFAERHGWKYTGHAPGITTRLNGFPFGVGTHRHVDDCITGRYGGFDCSHFTYRFEYRMGQDRAAEQVFTMTVATLEVPVDRLDLVPEDGASRIMSAITGTDIDLESAEFNRSWRLMSPNKRFAVDVVDPRMMEHLLRYRLPGVAVRIESSYVIAWSAGYGMLEDIVARLNLVTGIASRMPAHVVRRFSELDEQRRQEEAERWAAAPSWATQPGVLNSRTYTGIDVSGDDDRDGGVKGRKR